MSEIAVEDPTVTASTEPEAAVEAPLQIGDLLVEDVSIDGMCGVY